MDTLDRENNALAEGELILLAQRGDTVARDRLIAGLLPRVRQLAGRFFNTGLNPDDLAQDALLHLVQKKSIETYESGRNASLATYLLGICRNRMIDFVRREKLRKMGPLPDDHSEHVVFEGGTPEEQVIRAQLVDKVREVFHSLDPHDHLILRLRHGSESRDGYTANEIGQMIGCPKATVVSRDHRARQRMRLALEAVGITF